MSIDDLLNGRLKFHVGSELEKYRVSTLFTKEPETIAWIDSWDPTDTPIFFDIGANIGIYSLYAAAQHENLKVFAFEPEQKNYIALSSNTLLNSFSGVNAFRIALSNSQGLVDLSVDDSRIGNSNAQINSQYPQTNDERSVVRVEKVLSFSLDFLIESMDFPSPHYIKIDVDGHEVAILNGAVNLLRKESLRSVLVEFNHQEQLEDWKPIFERSGLHIDTTFDSIEGHSSFRRAKKGSPMRNVIFSRKS
jgi:FkbM family methyltransferase